MTATLNFQIRDHMRELYPEHRLGVLTMLMLHADVRNRCWPSVDLLAHEMKLSPTKVSKAKQWLIAQGAIELVPFDKRVGDERKLPSRQHVYQLTGKVKIGEQEVPYLYYQAPAVTPEVNPSNAGNFNPSNASNTGVDNTTIGRGSIESESKLFQSKEILPEVASAPPAVVENAVVLKSETQPESVTASGAVSKSDVPTLPTNAKKPAINQCLKDAVAIHIQGIAPAEGTAVTGLLANVAAGVYKRRHGLDTMTGDAYREAARTIPDFASWYRTQYPGIGLPQNPKKFENHYQQFVSQNGSDRQPKDIKAQAAEFGLSLDAMVKPIDKASAA